MNKIKQQYIKTYPMSRNHNHVISCVCMYGYQYISSKSNLIKSNMLLPFAILTQTYFTTGEYYHLNNFHKAYPACIACSSAILVTPQLVRCAFFDLYPRAAMGTAHGEHHDPKFFRTNSNVHPISNKSGSLLEAF